MKNPVYRRKKKIKNIFHTTSEFLVYSHYIYDPTFPIKLNISKWLDIRQRAPRDLKHQTSVQRSYPSACNNLKQLNKLCKRKENV
jgi:hypothetical protein